ncbi:MAG: UDP-N-acetylglucosamine 2-epimerase (non-hydrolyzing) [Chromatiales bacterium]|jgi:UDP-N-acetylglucosamine 2-epimerase (non-hydrolysing)
MGAERGRVLCVVGARPNFIKIAPIMRQLRRPGSALSATLVHTGQHYDAAMKASFFDQLDIPAPDVDLEVGSGSHAVQTGEVMIRFDAAVDRASPDLVLVVGDVNSTIACALVAVKKGIPVAHVEAGLRSHDRSMPEEINRILTDRISDLLFTTERSAEANLRREGIAPSSIHFVGNVMIDTLMHNLGRAAAPEDVLRAHGGEAFIGVPRFGVLTLHRPSNVDDRWALRRLLDTVGDLSERLPILFPVHPRTRGRITEAGMEPVLRRPGVLPLPPLGYLELLGLLRRAALVLTDSGGLQEETTALGVPCVTLRDNTERPVTIEEGTNVLVGTDPARINRAVSEILTTGGKRGRIPPLWDGEASRRIVDALAEWVTQRPQALTA